MRCTMLIGFRNENTNAKYGSKISRHSVSMAIDTPIET